MLFFFFCIYQCAGFPNASSRKESTCQLADTGDLGSIPGWGRSPGEGDGSPLQYSCLENPMDGGAWRDAQSTGLQRLGHACPWLYHHSLYTTLLVCVMVFFIVYRVVPPSPQCTLRTFPSSPKEVPVLACGQSSPHPIAQLRLIYSPASLDLPVLDFKWTRIITYIVVFLWSLKTINSVMFVFGG